MPDPFRQTLEHHPIEASAPCRIDLGGTLDIRTFSYPLHDLAPCTFNIALNLRTRVRLSPYRKGRLKVFSRGFESVDFATDRLPFDGPMGLMLAIAHYFKADGVRIDIESQSPPRSALGGSSAAAVALVAALTRLHHRMDGAPAVSRRHIALLAHILEDSVAEVPCGIQDQLASTFGGVNAWYWQGRVDRPVFKRRGLIRKKRHRNFAQHLLLAYCGQPHVSADINRRWIRQYLSGKYRSEWGDIIRCTHQFTEAIAESDFRTAAALMNQETALRRKMTPDVLDELGARLVEVAGRQNCGARFTGAGGGGCLWAIGEIEDIDSLRAMWEEILAGSRSARLIEVEIDSQGLVVH